MITLDTHPSTAAFSGTLEVRTSAGETPDALSAKQEVVALRDTPAPWLDQAISELTALLDLPPNWDSYGARSVDRQSVSCGADLLSYLAGYVGIEAPTVTATPDGDAAFCWDAGTWSLDASIDSSGLITYVFLNEQDHDQDRDTRTRDVWTLIPLLTRWR